MKKSRFTESQIVAILQEADAGTPPAELTRKHGISRSCLFKWKSKYGGVSVNELKRIKELEAENAKLKRMYAELALEKIRDQGRALPKTVALSAKREVVQVLAQEHDLPV